MVADKLLLAKSDLHTDWIPLGFAGFGETDTKMSYQITEFVLSIAHNSNEKYDLYERWCAHTVQLGDKWNNVWLGNESTIDHRP